MKGVQLRKRQGFTLVELLIAGAVGVVILTAVMGFLLHRVRRDRQEAALGRVKQDASLLMGQLGRELRQAGLGRPTRSRREGGGEFFPGPLLVADETALAFVADLPRPDASLHGLSAFAANPSLPPLPPRGVALLNELNGGCDVDGSAPAVCRTDASSLLLAAPGVDCRDVPAVAPTCPWGLRKYRPGEWLVLVDGVGRWVERQVDSGLFSTLGSRSALSLSSPLPADFFLDVPNRGWVASLDRIHYRLVGDAVVRKQCWGPVGTPATLAGLAGPCTLPAEGTPWEPLLRTVAPGGLVFRYLDAQGAVLAPLPLSAANLRRVRRVEVVLRLEVSGPGGPVTYDTFTAVALRH